MNASDLATANNQANELLSKLKEIDALLSSIYQKWSVLPCEYELEEFKEALPDPATLKKFAEVWASEALPTIDDLKDFTRELPSAESLNEFAEAWDKLPSIDDLKEYSAAAPSAD